MSAPFLHGFADRTFHKCMAINDQVDLLNVNSTATDVASVWTSILGYWFPPGEYFQVRQYHYASFIEVYALRVAHRPGEERPSYHPIICVRCYAAASLTNQIDWNAACGDALTTIHVVSCVLACEYPDWVGISCCDAVWFGDLRHAPDLRAVPELLGIQHVAVMKKDVQDFLDMVKEVFLYEWDNAETYAENYLMVSDGESVDEDGDEEEDDEEGESEMKEESKNDDQMDDAQDDDEEDMIPEPPTTTL
ncbi:hypothetical protein N7474_010381 [Penicillium riverlandense]|uniref:uncharacterized protein n=1 Tax=Penicillium riverlandense TaxID=1903569 RepID=UPI00254988C4|nr:uncharacterized protein N7474_010381 [Penicillium riverlandense]KAJ5806789.1 hypothetical protein N7474_010381 [Penicillium riverlandense]